LLGREYEFSPLRVKDHDAGCFNAVVDEDIRFAVNLDPGFVNRFQSNRPKWFLIYSFQDTLDRHPNSKARVRCRIQAANLKSGSLSMNYGTIPRISGNNGKLNANCALRSSGSKWTIFDPASNVGTSMKALSAYQESNQGKASQKKLAIARGRLQRTSYRCEASSAKELWITLSWFESMRGRNQIL
jgi:hypothetical protein